MQYFHEFQAQDLWLLGEATLRTLLVSVIAIVAGTILGVVVGWALQASRYGLSVLIATITDVFRSVPLLIQLILVYNFVPIIGLPLSAFQAGTLVLTLYCASMVASVTRAGIDAVGFPMRNSARSLGMSYWQSMRYIVWPIGLRAVIPSWVGVALGVIKDSALVSVLGYVELLRASQMLITRTQEPFLILGIAGLFYFALSYPLSSAAEKYERRLKS